MRKPLYIYFSEKNEYIINGNKTENNDIGDLLISFLDYDFEKLKKVFKMVKELVHGTLNEVKTASGSQNIDEIVYFIFSKFYRDNYEEIKKAHTLLANVIDYRLEETMEKIYGGKARKIRNYLCGEIVFYPDEANSQQAISDITNILTGGRIVYDPPLDESVQAFIDNFMILIDELLFFKKDFWKLVGGALDCNNSPTQASNLERLYNLKNNNVRAYEKTKSLIKEIRIENSIFNDGEKLSAFLFYASNDIRALLMLEFEYMCINNYYLKKCEYCGKYFQPFGVTSRYCDRTVSESGKTCKQIGAVMKSAENISDARKIYNKVNNRNQMRYARMPNGSKKGLEQWRAATKSALAILERDNLDVDEFERVISGDYTDVKAWLEKHGID
jgi:hypothetical protein